MRLKRILLATDLSPASMAAEQLAAELAKRLHAGVSLLFCAAPLPATGLFAVTEIAAVLREQDEAARVALAGRARMLRKRGVPVREFLVTGEPAPTIVDEARKLRADVIVLGTHGRGGFSRWTIGSVAERVVRTAACPVLTVRASVGLRHPARRGGGRKRPRSTASRRARSEKRAQARGGSKAWS
jgi:nucleotide-binding universal stress UspA family protein